MVMIRLEMAFLCLGMSCRDCYKGQEPRNTKLTRRTATKHAVTDRMIFIAHHNLSISFDFHDAQVTESDSSQFASQPETIHKM